MPGCQSSPEPCLHSPDPDTQVSRSVCHTPSATLPPKGMALPGDRVTRVCSNRPGCVQPLSEKGTQWFARHPRGMYTCLRTMGPRRLLMLDMHIDRLLTGLDQMTSAEWIQDHGIQTPHARIKAVLHERGFDRADTLTKAVVQRYQECLSVLHPLDTDDLRVSVLVTSASVDCDMLMVVEYLPPRPPPPYHMQLCPGHRQCPEVKDTHWIRERQKYETLVSPPVNEVCLYDTVDGAISEGLSSNFFAIYPGKEIRTSPAVLIGTMRRLVLEVAPSLGYKVVPSAPLVHEASDWEGCFVTSTSRRIVPVSLVHMPPYAIPQTGAGASDGCTDTAAGTGGCDLSLDTSQAEALDTALARVLLSRCAPVD
ncbi:aminotransferase class IV [Kipferlia bialata]|uniref:Aminotransferase class IV n=1 Tax=Kipferlia bialata TaxID=797122 RepID=A0A9K3CVQ1_9EUKA|nr:aminotransferase class IV [Kipferlia bialata]|eukprot:g4443.t1